MQTFFTLHIDTKDSESIAKNFDRIVKKAMEKAGKSLITATKEAASDIARMTIKDDKERQKFIDGMKIRAIGTDGWMIVLSDDAMEVNEATSVEDSTMNALMKRGAATRKVARAAYDLTSTVKSVLRNFSKKNQKVTIGGINKDSTGKPKLGNLHRFNVGSTSVSVSQTEVGKSVKKTVVAASGNDTAKIIDKAIEWALHEWESKTSQKLLEDIVAGI